MLTSIKVPVSAAPKTESATDLLLGCHQRIRHFTDVALRLATLAGATDADVASAAAAVHRYYTVGLPLHEADENETVYPRLARVAADELAAANQAMYDQHRELDALIADLVPLWAELMQHPRRLSELQPRLQPLTERLSQLWNTHLDLEEATVFPAMGGSLSAADLAAMAAEMRARRVM
jgi:hemerythrin-like domain-containing protein